MRYINCMHLYLFLHYESACKSFPLSIRESKSDAVKRHTVSHYFILRPQTTRHDSYWRHINHLLTYLQYLHAAVRLPFSQTITAVGLLKVPELSPHHVTQWATDAKGNAYSAVSRCSSNGVILALNVFTRLICRGLKMNVDEWQR